MELLPAPGLTNKKAQKRPRDGEGSFEGATDEKKIASDTVTAAAVSATPVPISTAT